MGNINDKGVVLIAMGHKNYLKMAVNLLASIRHKSKVPVHLIHDADNQPIAGMFTSCTCITEHKDPIRCKVDLYRLTPFKRTMFIDVDTILMPSANIDTLFAELEGSPLAIPNLSRSKFIWASYEQICECAGASNNAVYQYHSEIIYFEKSKEVYKYFKEAMKYYDSPGLDYRPFVTGVPDELAFMLASVKTGLLSSKLNWCPVYWHFREPKTAWTPLYRLDKSYLIYSIGGNTMPKQVAQAYNTIVSYYTPLVGFWGYYKAIAKSKFDKNRIKI